MINNPVINPSGQLAHGTPTPTTATPAPGNKSPIKVEAAQQYTRFANEVRLHPDKLGSIANQCPRNAQVANVAAVDSLPHLTTSLELSSSARGAIKDLVMKRNAISR